MGPPHTSAFKAVKGVASSIPVLRYYNSTEEVTLLCDASQRGLEAALFQNGQPAVKASRALRQHKLGTPKLRRNCLAIAIVFACKRAVRGVNLYTRQNQHANGSQAIGVHFHEATERNSKAIAENASETSKVPVDQKNSTKESR